MNEPDWLVRVVEEFDKITEELVGVYRLHTIELSRLQEIWKQNADEPMVDSFDISPTQAEALREYTSIDFDLSRCDYQITAYTTDFEAARVSGGFLGRIPPPLELAAFPGTYSTKARSSVDN